MGIRQPMELDNISPAIVVSSSLRIAQFLREKSSAAIPAAFDNALASRRMRECSRDSAQRQFDQPMRFGDKLPHQRAER